MLSTFTYSSLQPCELGQDSPCGSRSRGENSRPGGGNRSSLPLQGLFSWSLITFWIMSFSGSEALTPSVEFFALNFLVLKIVTSRKKSLMNSHNLIFNNYKVITNLNFSLLHPPPPLSPPIRLNYFILFCFCWIILDKNPRPIFWSVNIWWLSLEDKDFLLKHKLSHLKKLLVIFLYPATLPIYLINIFFLQFLYKNQDLN